MRVIIPKEEIEKANFGTTFIDTQNLETIKALSGEEKHPLEVALDWLTKQNPTYSFSGVFDSLKGGANIYWRPMEIGNQ